MNAAENPEFTEGTAPSDTPQPNTRQMLLEDPELLARLFEQFTPKGRDAFSDKPLFKHRTLTFVVDGSQCEPGIFEIDGVPFDFKLTMRSLDSEKELSVLESVGHSNHVQAAFAKAMIFEMNGKTIQPRQRDWLWQALGMRGRQLCMLAYQQLGNSGAVALGKFQASLTVG